ncbi:MAG: isoprenylcysteine carboxylmethyltransferase family protein [Ignavibacteriales bacterium]|nr:isoprenylcysteine carboxylmethyltransferase family protein [Ignavibacteriales bacterium]
MSQLRQKLFQYRSYTPTPFLIVMILYAHSTLATLLIGFALAVAGEFMRAWGVAYAGSLTRVTGGVGAPELIVAGPFSYVRNPLYVGNMLMYVGIGVMANALTPWLVLVAAVYFFFQYAMIVSLEEEFLEKTFGAAFMEYKQQVPRFVPRMVSYKHLAQSNQLPDWREALRSETRTLQAFVLVIALLLVKWYWSR